MELLTANKLHKYLLHNLYLLSRRSPIKEKSSGGSGNQPKMTKSQKKRLKKKAKAEKQKPLVEKDGASDSNLHHNKAEKAAQSAQIPPTQPVPSFATLTNQGKGVKENEPAQTNRQTNDGSGKDSLPLGVQSKITSSQIENSRAVTDSSALPQGKECAVSVREVPCDESPDVLQQGAVGQEEAPSTKPENNEDAVLAPAQSPPTVSVREVPCDEQQDALQRSPEGQVEASTSKPENGGECAVLAPDQPPPDVPLSKQPGVPQNSQAESQVEASTARSEGIIKKDTSSAKADDHHGHDEYLQETTAPDGDRRKAECHPTETQGEDVDVKKALESEEATSIQGSNSAPERRQSGTELEEEEPDTMQEMSSKCNDDQKKTCSQTKKDAKMEHKPSEQKNEPSVGNGNQPKMSKRQRKKMEKKAKAEQQKNSVEPVKKDGASDRQRKKAGKGKPSHPDDGEEIEADDQIEEEDDKMSADKMTIYFHVLLRPGDFKYNPVQDHVEVRSNLNKDFKTLLKMSRKGKTDGYFVLEGKTSVSPHQVAGKAVEYKYAIVKDKGKGRTNIHWEFIHRWSSSGTIINRCMLIPKDRAKPGGVWHQYNDFMLPEDSTGASIVNWVKESFGFDRNGLIDARTEAVRIWLPKWEGLYGGDDAYSGNAADALSQIDDVDRGIARPLIVVGNSRPEVWELQGFNMKKVIEDYMSTRWDTFLPTSKEKQFPTDRLVSALAITYLVWKFGMNPSKEREADLLQALSVTVDTDKMTCEGLKEVFSHFDPVYIRELPTSIYSLVQRALLKGNPTPKWLLAIPILHFLRGDSRPFKQPDEEAKVGDRLWFGLEGMDKLWTSAKRCRFQTTEDNGRTIREMCSVCEYSLGVIVRESLSCYAVVASAVSVVASCMRLASAMLKPKGQEVEDADAAHVTRKELTDRIAQCYKSTSEAVHAWLKKNLCNAIASRKMRGDYESALTYPDEPKISLVYQAELFCQLDLEKLNSVVAECFTSAAFTAVESLCETKQEGEFLNKIAAFSPAAEKYGKLFSYVLRKTWHRIDEICEASLLRHLLTWQPFLGFFKMYAGASVLKETLDGDCQEKIAVAVSELEDVQKKLLDGTLTVESLEILIKCSCRFLELCKIIHPYNQGGEESEKTQQKPKQIYEEIFSTALDRRRVELEAFKEERRQLQTFLGMTEIIGQVDRSTLQQKVDANIDNLPVDDLCAAVKFDQIDDIQATANGFDLNEVPRVTYFNIAPRMKAILGPVGRLENSIVFHAIWKEQAEESRSRIRKQRDAELDEMPHLSEATEENPIVLSIDQVVTEVCQPALKAWEKQREDIETGEITFEDVDRHFGGTMGKEQDLHQEIATLSNNPKACWVKERTDQIRQYHLLEQYTDKARSVNDVRHTYQLEGDFSSVQTLLDSKNASFKMRPLRSIDDSVFQATSMLADLTEATSDALNTFVLSKPLVEWMRVHTKDTKELKVFADLASISAGETDIEIDRVNMLLSAGIGYGPLIYDLKKDAGFTEMMQAVKRLETYLTQDPNLPKKLRDMKNHLAWLTHVQESHGSVEKSSLSQAEAINAKGIYEIGDIIQPKDIHEPLDGVISLRLSQAEGDADDRHYSVSNLKTLQSKLMLIAGTADKGKEEVEKFVEVFNGVSRLGNVYLRLRKTGSVLFDKWTCTVFCDPNKKVKAIIDFGFGSSTLTGKDKDLVTEVTNLAKLMESCLEGWLEFVDFKRGVYPELNNFTTEQIVVLRRELANVVNGAKASSQAIVLLDSVKTLCTVNDLQEAFSMIDLDDEITVDIGDEALVEDGQEGASSPEGLDQEALLRELHKLVSDLSDDVANAALKVSKRGTFDETLNEAMDWCIMNHNNEELAQKILVENKDDTADQNELDLAEANLEQTKEQVDPRENASRLAPLMSASSLGDLTRRFVDEAKERDE
uniref:Uncharacterized protein n=1 Tax=Branchiostoma floridae TaxID=7739 RepID=C3ZFR9_BRAFL|eukprot:XP_002592546.1 hypothetical protein BRAFLDRAFT_108418 [Branchiostoma floridae]